MHLDVDSASWQGLSTVTAAALPDLLLLPSSHSLVDIQLIKIGSKGAPVLGEGLQGR
jgi:hypothetical protein